VKYEIELPDEVDTALSTLSTETDTTIEELIVSAIKYALLAVEE
jgi:hypothetical protein